MTATANLDLLKAEAEANAAALRANRYPGRGIIKNWWPFNPSIVRHDHGMGDR